MRGKAPSQQMTFLVLFRVSLALLLGCSMVYTMSLFRMADDGEVRLRKASEIASRRIQAASFADAVDYLETVDLHAGPVYILVMSGKSDGDYWCGDCRNAKAPIADAFAKAPSAARLLEVSVGSPDQWRDVHNSFRTDNLLRIGHIPALLQYEGNMRTSRLLLEKFAADPELLEDLFHVPEPLVAASGARIQAVDKASDMVAILTAYDSSYPLYLFFISGTDPDTGRLWCPHCDSSKVPVEYYFTHYAPSNAVMLKITTADTYEAWQDKNNPFIAQSFVKIGGLPALMRAVPHSQPKLLFEEYPHFFEDRSRLVQFYAAA
ncbi:hypothetical protein ACHHYP_05631 [Achlya hypogyna]|uniref:Thioredoxin domain-containing protein n=1 Tax=Achlya hypogyna TaxID=1202772 RepID=A0A1V9YX74_ACHHY|nr:hypothetical protein ACHHYP_05631 [Achlya hypogyna]